MEKIDIWQKIFYLLIIITSLSILIAIFFIFRYLLISVCAKELGKSKEKCEDIIEKNISKNGFYLHDYIDFLGG